MKIYLSKLLEISGSALSEKTDELPYELTNEFGNSDKISDIIDLLQRKNGFYAFESALHVFPGKTSGGEVGLIEWNKPELWIGKYEGIADNCTFFSEDIFGGQFCIKDKGIYLFDPETGYFEYIANSIEGWAEAILKKYSVLTGYPIAHAWQTVHGSIPAGKRLIPKIPFIMGGTYSIDNVYAADSVKAMHIRAAIVAQIKHLRDGDTVKLKVVD